MICVDVSCLQNDYSFLLCSLDLLLTAAHRRQSPDFEHSSSSKIQEKAQINVKWRKRVDVPAYTFFITLSLFPLNNCSVSFHVYFVGESVHHFSHLTVSSDNNYTITLYISVFVCACLWASPQVNLFQILLQHIMQQMAHILWTDFFIQTEV